MMHISSENTARDSCGSGQPRPAARFWRKSALLSLLFLHHLPHGALAEEGVLQKMVDGLASALDIGPGGSSTSLSPSTFTSTSASPAAPGLGTRATLALNATSTLAPRNTTSPARSTTSISTSSSRTSLAATSSSRASLAATSSSSRAPLATASQVPAANGTATLSRAVFAHFIVGNTYNYTVQTWYNDIALAASKGVDAFALNVGADAWETSQVANAFSAAARFNANATLAQPTFGLFFSFDMSSFPCSAASQAAPLQAYMRAYANDTNTFRYRQGASGSQKMLVSTFAGEGCRFGKGGLNEAWISVVKPGNAVSGGALPAVSFIPSFFVDPQTFANLTVADGFFHWNSGWPMGNYNITFEPDQSYISKLGNRTYMAAVSPWFFTHYGPNTFNKNWIYRGDDWLFAQRWEMLVQNRAAVPLAQVVTWNDYGESHYVGPIEGIQPMSQAWVNGFDHQGWLDLMKYYITAYKTGSYPAITKDRVFLWARLYPAAATVQADAVGRPANSQWTEDYLWAVTLLTAPANVTLSCGTSSQRTVLPAGLSKLKLKLSTSCAVNAVVMRGATTSVNFAPVGFNFSTRPPSYNFNAFVAASPA